MSTRGSIAWVRLRSSTRLAGELGEAPRRILWQLQGAQHPHLHCLPDLPGEELGSRIGPQGGARGEDVAVN